MQRHHSSGWVWFQGSVKNSWQKPQLSEQRTSFCCSINSEGPAPHLALPLTTPLPSTDLRGKEATQKVEKNQLTQKSGRGKQIVDVESPRTAVKQIFQWGNFFCEKAWKVNFQAQVISHFYSIQVSAAHFLHHISIKFLQSSIARKCALYKCFFYNPASETKIKTDMSKTILSVLEILLLYS